MTRARRSNGAKPRSSEEQDDPRGAGTVQVTSSPEKAADVSRATNRQRSAASDTPADVPKRKRSKTERAIRRIGWNLLPPLTFFGMESKVLLTVLLTFFPLLIASISGFQILDDRLLYLTKSMGATSWETFRYLRFPAALPVIFSGIKTSATIAATAAIVAEFVGANEGLGYVLLRGTSTMELVLVFPVLAVLPVVGIAINYHVAVREWLMTRG